MARDTEKYAYYTVGILKGSELHRRLLAEAEQLGKRHVPLTINLWLRGYLKLSDPPCKVECPSDRQEEPTVDLSNAAEASDYWG